MDLSYDVKHHASVVKLDELQSVENIRCFGSSVEKPGALVLTFNSNIPNARKEISLFVKGTIVVGGSEWNACSQYQDDSAGSSLSYSSFYMKLASTGRTVSAHVHVGQKGGEIAVEFDVIKIAFHEIYEEAKISMTAVPVYSPVEGDIVSSHSRFQNASVSSFMHS